ncbi:hypothetical protein EDD15DRAFT_2202800 [Pisolithus albus]|nr:hypothetical protein EDD15DRAFT_2202800 [Pisolithus albus]
MSAWLLMRCLPSTGLFNVHAKPPPAAVLHALSPVDTLAMYVRDHKRSGSVTIVEGRRSGVWISQGDAIDGKGKFGRARYYHNDSLAKTSAKLKCYQCSLCDVLRLLSLPSSLRRTRGNSLHTYTLGIAGIKKDVYGGEIELIRILDPPPPGGSPSPVLKRKPPLHFEIDDVPHKKPVHNELHTEGRVREM